MLDNLGFGELLVLVIVALFVFGPDRLPKAAAEAGRMLRELRRLANRATSELRAELGPELADVNLASLRPRRLVSEVLLADEPEAGAAPAARPSGPPLRPGERAPFDPDAT